MKNIIDAGEVCPSAKVYRVSWAHNHDTLRNEDLVIMVEGPKSTLLLYRPLDATLHDLKDGYDQYVHLEDAEL
jgi:hypothetical protein